MQGFRQFMEMPINKLQLMGDWGPKDRPRYYDKPSIGILTSEKGVEKIKRQWKKTDQTFDMYFLRIKGMRDIGFKGEVDEYWVHKNIGSDIKIDPENITIFYAGNQGSPREPMTGWVLAHRLGHAIENTTEYQHYNHELHRYIQEVANNIYNQSLKLSWPQQRGYPQFPSFGGDYQNILTMIANSLGTMGSARKNKVFNLREFGFELLAQYIITGKISLNTDLKNLQRGGWGNKTFLTNQASDEEIEDMQYYLKETVSSTLEYYVSDMLRAFEGRIFVV